VSRSLEQERLDHVSLKRTWQMANDQFLSSQRQLLADVRRMQTVLTAKQKLLVAGQFTATTTTITTTTTTATNN